MRLFIAILVPKTLHRYCKQIQEQFDGLKKTKEFHLTLQFLGDGIEDVNKIIKALNKIEFQPFTIEMGNATPFGPKKEPRGIWIECKESQSLKKLADEIRQQMAPLGFILDKPFKAHITLGRYKFPPKTTPKETKNLPNSFKVSHFELIQSHLGVNGPHYKTLKQF